MPTYDLNDPTDLDIMRGQFNMYTADDWDEYIEIAEERIFTFSKIKMASR